MEQHNLPVHDLYALLAGEDLQNALGPDGVHPSEHGRDVFAQAVATLWMTSLLRSS